MLKPGLIKHVSWVRISDMRKCHCILIITVFLLASCNEETIKVASNKYYDLAAFFRLEAKTLDNLNMKLEKKIVKDSIIEEKSFEKINWLNELSPFIDCDINKPAWINSYRTDTLQTNVGMKVVYTAIEDKLPVRTIELTINKNKITEITTHKVRHNFYYQSEDLLTYHVQKGYEISGSQNVRLLDKTYYRIIALYLH